MMTEGTLGVVIIWHMHQPYYGVSESKCLQMPWVRLHGTKNYHDMASILSDHPRVKVTFNFAPSLLRQIKMYTEENATDRLLELCMHAPEKLQEEKVSIKDLLFMVNSKSIQRFPRYRDLYRKYQAMKEKGGEKKKFRAEEFADLKILYNLAWFNPSHLSDPRLKPLVEKGRGFGHKDIQAIREKTYELLSEIIPLYRNLSEEGRIELTSSPYYHPILPLLIDTDIAREAFPESDLPSRPFRSPEDAREQITRAVASHRDVFGTAPTGMWPSEGSVSHDLAGHLIDSGIKWVATDEAILLRSIDEKWEVKSPRDENPPLEIFQPHIVEHEDRDLLIFFRDNYLSDQIGFTYFNMELKSALDHFKCYLKAAREEALEAGIENPVLTIVVDGENPWENYDNDGLDFLHGIYQILEDEPLLNAMTPSDYISHLKGKVKDLPRLDHLSPGSWIGGDFRIWIGHPETNTAWDRLGETREYLVSRSQSNDVDPEGLIRAWEEIYIAEGSDWFWWYGDDFTSDMDAEFDRLFRIHLIRVYELLGDDPPDNLYHPISATNDISMYTAHLSTPFSIQLDGEISSFYEWSQAKRYKARDNLFEGDERLIDAIYWGCSKEELVLRCDLRSETLADSDSVLSLTIFSPSKQKLIIPMKEGVSDVYVADRVVGKCFLGKILEITVPFDSLGLIESDTEITFILQEKSGGVIGATYPLGELFRVLK